jgi:hypothetical protein
VFITPPARALERENIREIPVSRWAELGEQVREAQLPIVLRQAIPSSCHVEWGLDVFAREFGQRRVTITTNLPDHGAPYWERSGPHETSTTMAALSEMLRNGDSCYLNQTPVSEFPTFQRALDIRHLRLGRLFSANVWIGSRPRSGLHYDSADNLFLQIHGRKRALLIDPKFSRNVYPFSDNPSKSRIDPETPDFKNYPLFAKVKIWDCVLAPGDALYIPRGWWHFIAAEEVSVSVNFWHGDALNEVERSRRFLAGGPRVWFQAARDLIWHGVLHKPYQPRLFSPAPPGLEAYRQIARTVRRKRA